MPISFDRALGEGSGVAASSVPFCSSPAAAVSLSGGTLDCLSFSVVGDTRPPVIDDTAQYPTAVISKIWERVQAESPRPAFAVTTGDYVFARPSGSQASAQLDLYLQAQSVFGSPVFHALGNHECTGATTSNCGTGNHDGVTKNYSQFLSRMVPPGVSKPYYSVNFSATDGSWTAKMVLVAANAWDSAQAAWLEQTLSQPTTYTFIVRHEPKDASTAPGVSPSEAIMAQHPYTLALVGHTHTFKYNASSHEVVIGLGGAPLTGSIGYGYLVARQRVDGAIQFFLYDSDTHSVKKTFAVDKDGNPVASSNSTPTPTPSSTATPAPSPVELIANGGFESSLGAWTLGGVKNPIASTAQAHGGTHSLRAGATSAAGHPEPNGESWAYQTVSIPSSATSAQLSFWWYGASTDAAHDWQSAQIRSTSGTVHHTLFKQASDTQTWTQATLDLLPWKGQSVEIFFDVFSDGGTDPTTLWVDDVSVRVE